MSLADAFAGIAKPAAAEAPKRLGAQVPKSLGARAATPPLPLQGTAKSRHPEFEAVKVYLRRRTHKLARRKCEDEDQGDFSDLVEQLLQRYLMGT